MGKEFVPMGYFVKCSGRMGERTVGEENFGYYRLSALSERSSDGAVLEKRVTDGQAGEAWPGGRARGLGRVSLQAPVSLFKGPRVFI
jgi:hypothetical protein